LTENPAAAFQRRVASLALALFLFQHSRRDARRDAGGNLLTLDKQDRARWDYAAIAEGIAILGRTRQDGPYTLQARIAACHATAASAEATDWPEIAKCYDELADIQPLPVIELNRSVAYGYAYGPAAGLALLAQARAGGALDDYPYAVAAEADLTARHGDHDRAAALLAGTDRSPRCVSCSPRRGRSSLWVGRAVVDGSAGSTVNCGRWHCRRSSVSDLEPSSRARTATPWSW
jgi:Family of unknown function (DUF6596)